METVEIIKKILNENLDIDPADVKPDSTFDTLGIDSLDMAELICTLEDEMDIDFGEPEGLETVEDLVEYLDNL